MAIYGQGVYGAAVTGPTRVFQSLPFRGYRDNEGGAAAWREEFVDALGADFDVSYERFLSATARAAMLDPTYTPTETATDWLATATAKPLLSVSPDTMLDVLAYIALAWYPLDGNLTIAKRQALVAIGADLLMRKGTRLRIARFLATMSTSGAAYAVTSPPFAFSLALTDGEPTPGYKSAAAGGWVQATSTTLPSARPWIIPAARNILEGRAFPAWSTLGLGFSQFRIGYSALGEPIFPTGARMNLLQDEHFNDWVAGALNTWSWNAPGAAVITQQTAGEINWEFATNCADLDLTAAAAGSYSEVSQSAIYVDNQRTYRFEVDYAYRQAAAPFTSRLEIELFDETNSLYYTGSAWQTAAASIVAPPTATATGRERYGFAFTFSAASSTLVGTRQVRVLIRAVSDGTASSQIVYRLFRAGLYAQWDHTTEVAAGGERLLSLPLVDATGYGNFGRIAGGVAVEGADRTRASVKTFDTGAAAYPLFPYHPALSERGYLCNSAWTNLATDGQAFTTDWTLTNVAATANQIAPPVIGAGATATTFQKTAVAQTIVQTVVNPSVAGRYYVAGVWARKRFNDANPAITVNLRIAEAANDARRDFTIAYSDGWKLCTLSSGWATTGGASVVFQISPSDASVDYSLWGAFCYEVPGPDVLYPPVVLTTPGATATLGANSLQALASANIRDPLMQRQMFTLTQGSLSFETVPMYGAASQPDGYLFDCGQGAAQNRLSVRIASGAIHARLIDNGGASHAAIVTLSTLDDPGVGAVTWRRDTALTVRVRWDQRQGIGISVGDGHATTSAGVPWTVSDAALGTINIGCDRAQLNQYNGIIRNVELIGYGPPL